MGVLKRYREDQSQLAWLGISCPEQEISIMLDVGLIVVNRDEGSDEANVTDFAIDIGVTWYNHFGANPRQSSNHPSSDLALPSTMWNL